MPQNEVIVYTDGSALRNPAGPMGWAWWNMLTDERNYGGAMMGTNNIGELSAVLDVLRFHRNVMNLVIRSDSQYAINCSTTWVKGWVAKGWRKADKKPVNNLALVRAIYDEIEYKKSQGGSVHFEWVKGHAGHKGNEICDTLAHGFSSQLDELAKQASPAQPRTAHAGLGQASQHIYRATESGRMPLEGWAQLLHDGYIEAADVDPQVLEQIEHYHFFS